MQRLLIILGSLFIMQVTRAQPDVLNHLQQFNTDNGLPSNGIKGLQWDESTGFLWIATEAGIARFNGVDFRSYTRDNTASIGSERMLFITRNMAGKVYISDLAGNIFNIQQNKPVLWKKSFRNRNPYTGNYYLLAVSDSFFLDKIERPEVPSFSAVSDKIIGLNDTSCIVLNSSSLNYSSISMSKPIVLPIDPKNIISLFQIDQQIVFSTRDKKTYLLDPRSRIAIPVDLTDESGRSISPEISNLNLFWESGMRSPVYINQGNAYLFDARDGRLTARLIFSGIPADAFIKSVQYSEKNHILFIGTDSKGLIVINENRVEPKRRSDINPRNRNSYYAQIELDNGNILTNEGDIIGNSREPVSLPFKGKFTFNISITQDSLLWFSTLEPDLGHSCLHKFNRISRRITRYPELRADGVIAVSGKENFFASINGIYKLEADSFITLVRSSVQLFNNPVTDFKEIEPGKLAVATCGGLFRFNIRENKLDTLLKKEAGCIRTIWKYKEYVFLGSYGSGFFIYKNGIFKKMPVDKNKYLLYTHCFIPDDFGYCWISTNRGLFKASLKELLEAYENDTRTVYYHYFGKKDGMDMTELNGGCTPCALQMKNKTISFPSMDGLLWVNPEKARPVLPEGGIYIDEFLVNGRNLPPDSLDQVYLPANTNEIYIRLGYAAWCNKENIYLDYQLNDTMNWKTISTNDDAVIRLVGLPSGKHLLRIRKLNGFGIDNYSYSEIRFTILTPWYKQWWFYLLILFAILGIASLYSQIRNKQLLKRERKLEQQVAEKTSELKEQNEILEKNNSIKTRLISIISHDIVTPLKFVTVAGKNLIEKRALMPEELQQETIREMTNTAQELQLLSTNILNWIKYQNENRRLAKETFSLNDMINQVIGVISSLAKQKKIRLVNTTDPDLKIHQYFEPLKILVYNLLTNAINFSEKGDIVISVKPAEGMVILSVSDEGVGMTAEQIKNVMADQFIISSNNIDNKKGNGLGYLIIKDLVKMMDARLVINSRKNEGTTVSVYVPDGLSG